ncbi:hypothetical protein [Roseateles sp. LKC17W]|uniref:Uncharacterized protein n=1 Tax=Pelomonas margarita TaxID=3299031 RepID=A0ABW7FC48_9BURK
MGNRFAILCPMLVHCALRAPAPVNLGARVQMKPWNLNETRDQIARVYGRDQLTLARDSLRSIDDRQIYAWVHYQDAVQLIDRYVREHLLNSSLLEAIHAKDDDYSIEFDIFIRKVGAHFIACIQSIHTLPDILAHAVYYSLGINLTTDAMEERSITAGSVTRLLATVADAVTIGLQLTQLTSSGLFRHLSALANHSKHRSIVFPFMNEDWTGTRPDRYMVMFSAFTYNREEFDQVDAKDFLSKESDRCSRLIVEIGHELNKVLLSRAP